MKILPPPQKKKNISYNIIATLIHMVYIEEYMIRKLKDVEQINIRLVFSCAVDVQVYVTWLAVWRKWKNVEKEEEEVEEEWRRRRRGKRKRFPLPSFQVLKKGLHSPPPPFRGPDMFVLCFSLFAQGLPREWWRPMTFHQVSSLFCVVEENLGKVLDMLNLFRTNVKHLLLWQLLLWQMLTLNITPTLTLILILTLSWTKIPSWPSL